MRAQAVRLLVTQMRGWQVDRSGASAPVAQQLQEIDDANAARVEVARRSDHPPLAEQGEKVDDPDHAVAVATVPRTRVFHCDDPAGLEDRVGKQQHFADVKGVTVAVEVLDAEDLVAGPPGDAGAVSA